MEAGDVVFVRPSGVIGWLVTKFDGGEFSHVAIAVNDTHIAEAQYFTRSRIVPAYSQDVHVVKTELSHQQRYELQQNAITVMGRWYDFKLIAYYFFRHLFKWELKALWNAQNNLICSELVAGLLLSVGYEGAEGIQDQNITPRELYEHLAAYQKMKEAS